MADPIRLGLIGAGIFMRDDHVPALKALGDRFDVVAVYSRTYASAEALQPHLAHPTDIYTDLDQLLARPDIEAVDIVLPIENLPWGVEKSLAAGKHVISEKPITPDVATGRRMLELYRNYPNQIWMIAENWRTEESFHRAGEIVRSGRLGKLIATYWTLLSSMRPDNKYYHTPWRHSGTFPGGFLMDGGVHHIAAFRQILGEIIAVSAQTRLMLPDLPPADTLSAVIEFESGLIGQYMVTYAASAPFPRYLTIVGEAETLRVTAGYLEVSENGAMQQIPVESGRDVYNELAAFAASVRDGQPNNNPPLEALRDVAVIEAMLQSGVTNQRVEVVKLSL